MLKKSKHTFIVLHLGPVHLTPEKFENAALFLSSSLIRHENGAFRKRFSNRRNLKTPTLCFSADGNILKTDFFGNDDVTIISDDISVPEVFSLKSLK